MAHDQAGRMLVIIGSGETSPTMVELHKELVAGLGPATGRAPMALLLATPYAFQENAAAVSARSRRYFADSVGLPVRVIAGTSHRAGPDMAPPAPCGDGPGTAAAAGEPGEAREAAAVRDADWVFAGPGNPSYALAHWQAGPIGAALRERVLGGTGLTVLASAAAAAAGRYTLPVYEIYKAGGALRWLPGLDLLGALGLPVALIPHYDNAEGRHYDTRYCYLGERRLAVMERELPGDAAVLGVDEHTAVLIDSQAGMVEVRGRGGLTVRRGGADTAVPAGTRLSLADLRELIRQQGRRAAAAPAGTGPAAGGGRSDGRSGRGSDAGDGTAGSGPPPLPEVMAAADREFTAAARHRDADAMADVIVRLETTIGEWDADTDEDQGTEQARALLHALIGRLARAARDGLADPADRLGPAVEPLLVIRDALRDDGNFPAADAIRAALAAAGIEVSDTPDGTRWEPARGS